MDQEGASYLTSDSGFNVPIILSSEGLGSFSGSEINETGSNHLSEEADDMRHLHNEISQEDDLKPSLNLESSEIEDSPVVEESEASQTQNLKVRLS